MKPGSRWITGLIALLATAMAGVTTARAQCPPPPPSARNPTVRLDLLEPRLIYRHDLDLLGLARIEHTFEVAPKGGVVLGLTRRNDNLVLQIRSLRMRSVDGRTCIWPIDVAARIGNPEMDVYVAANYPVGSCEYNVVLEHENQHVNINRRVVATYGPQVGASLRNAVHRLFPMITSNPNDVNRLPRILADAVKPDIDAMIAEMRRENGAIDTPENYRLTGLRCKNWFPPGTRIPERR